ncbi:hypothetical protein LTR85_001099 [Meristemomyces frigidus]|nr:hypothetical protein LTR85_001099 [Meristemomyces frigidus]
MDSTDSCHNRDDWSTTVYSGEIDTLGFCQGYQLRRHRDDAIANDGAHEARRDWMEHIGPIEQFGSCNPYDGNFTSLVLPFTKPDRLRLAAYIHEYAFMYDNVLESAKKATLLDKHTDGLILERAAPDSKESVMGAKQLQSKIILELTNTDKRCAERVLSAWKTMVATTQEQKSAGDFQDIEHYVRFRSIDTGAPFVEAIMLFGMGETLSSDEDAQLASIVAPCFAALGLANDYFSFDRELAELQESEESSMTNAVWLLMKWDNIDASEAKRRVQNLAVSHEKEFARKRDEFLRSSPTPSRKINQYLSGLSQQIVGNVVWSLRCPRYHANLRYDPNAGVENDVKTGGRQLGVQQIRDICTENPRRPRGSVIGESFATGDHRSSKAPSPPRDSALASPADSRAGSISSASSGSKVLPVPPATAFRQATLDTEHVLEPFDYVRKMPSKQIRDAVVDALNIWLEVPEHVVSRVKAITSLLHNASLMLDDIEDNSPLRRGKPAAHTIFGMPGTTNSANYAIVQAFDEARKLPSESALDVFIEQMYKLHIGQSYDLHWTRHHICPSEEEYLEMVDKKTGGLFQMLLQLLLLHSPKRSEVGSSLQQLLVLVGRFYQIRDDLQNLTSDEYTSNKGFCDDLDEGKYSYPLVQALTNSTATGDGAASTVRNILRTSSIHGTLTREMKTLVLEHLESCGGLARTRDTLAVLQADVEARVDLVEKRLHRKNWVLRVLLQKLAV